MKNARFDQAIDKIIDFVIKSQDTQMEQLKYTLKAAYDANVNTQDANAIAQQIMDTSIDPQNPVPLVENRMVYRIENQTLLNDPGILKDLSYVQNAIAARGNKDYYHHCPERQDDLVRLQCVPEDHVHACPVCKLVFR